MQKQSMLRIILLAFFVWLSGPVPRSLTARAPEPIIYTVRFPSPDTHHAEVEAVIPTHRSASIELMMPIWSPGFYRVEDYASRIQSLTARAPDGNALNVEQPRKNRWLIQTNGGPAVILSYRLLCNGRSVTTNWVGDDLLVLNGAATFITLAEGIRRPHDVKLELPAKWKRAMTALDAAPGGSPNQFRAADYDTLVDSPIVAGALAVREFDVDGSQHYVVVAGEMGQWDGEREAQDLEKIVRETRRFWGGLPFKRYVFLNVFRQGGGGLEHKNSTLLTSSPRMTAPNFRWLAFVSHEYFHAFNVKRLRPVELTTFDYERPPNTGSLWISEGLTSYYGESLVCRAGLGSPQDCLAALSSHISQLQNAPGRLLQTLEQSSLDVWNSGTSGVGRDTATKVSYYVKGPVVGFLLDAKIQRVTGGKKSLDDVMRLAYKRYSGARGFTPEQFRRTAEEVAGVDLREWFRKAISSVEELDYTEALDWFGLRFATTDGRQSAQSWTLEMREDATEAQRSRLRAWLGEVI
ncbi:MAG TPA: M61 family peptidase [Blastocatellia bacterium]|nr:M61 family peptidase [Blastocatellia bacterium]